MSSLWHAYPDQPMSGKWLLTPTKSGYDKLAAVLESDTEDYIN